MTSEEFRENVRAIFLAAIMVMSVVAIGAAGFAGSAVAQAGDDISVEEGENQDLAIGANDIELDRITLNDTADGAFGGETVITLPDHMTWVEGDTVTLSGEPQSFEIDGADLIIDHDTTSEEGDRLRLVEFVVDVDSEAEVVDKEPLTIDYQIGSGEVGDFFNLSKPEYDGADQEVSLAATNVTLDQGDEINVTTGDAPGEVGDEVILFADDEAGITWNATTADRDIIDDAGDLTVDEGNISVTDTEISIPIEEPSGAGEDVTFLNENLTVDVAADADNTTFGAAVVPEGATERVDATGEFFVNTTAPTEIVLSDEVDLAVGANNQSVDDDTRINVTQLEESGIGEGTEIVISANNTEVYFFDADLNTTESQDDLEADNLTVENGDIVIDVPEDFSEGDTAAVENVSFNVTNVPDNETAVAVEAQTQSSPDAEAITVTDQDTLITLLKPAAGFAGDDDYDLYVDNDGVITWSDDIHINATTDNQFAIGENVTVSLEDGTDVTFNETEDISVSGDAEEVVYEDGDLTFNVTDLGAQGVNVSNVQVAIDPGAQNTSLSVETHTGDSTVDVDFAHEYIVTQATPEAVNNVTADSENLPVGEEVESVVNVTNDNLNDVETDNAFGGATVELNLTDQPEDTDLDTEDVVDEVELVTDAQGNASFNFSSDTVGDYNITATAGNESTVIEYDVSAGELTEIETEGIENAVRTSLIDNVDPENDAVDNVTRTGVYETTLLDEGGNVVEGENFDFTLTISGEDAEIIGVYENFNESLDNGTFADEETLGDYSTVSPDDGTFYVVTASEQAQDVSVTVRPEEDIDNDDGTVQFFRSVSDVNVTLEETEIVGTQTTNVTAAPVSSVGAQIEVPRFSMDFESADTEIAEIDGDANVRTDTDGEAQTEVLGADVDEDGDVDIEAFTRQRAGADTLTVNAIEGDVNIDDQESAGNSVVVTNATYNLDDFVVVVHNETEDGEVGPAVGWSEDFDAGEEVEGLTVDLEDPLNESQNVTAMLHETAEDDDFGPSIEVDGEVVQDDAFVTIVDAVVDFQVEFVDAPDEVVQGEDYNVTVNVTNEGDATGTQTVAYDTYEVVNGVSNAWPAAPIESDELELDPGETAEVTFEIDGDETEGYPEGDYMHRVENDDGVEFTEAFTFVHEEVLPEIDVTGDGEPATDTTGDGLLNDVNGDGEFSIFDIQALFNNMDTINEEYPEYTEYFNFAGDDPDEVTIFDVQALFNQLQQAD